RPVAIAPGPPGRLDACELGLERAPVVVGAGDRGPDRLDLVVEQLLGLGCVEIGGRKTQRPLHLVRLQPGAEIEEGFGAIERRAGAAERAALRGEAAEPVEEERLPAQR